MFNKKKNLKNLKKNEILLIILTIIFSTLISLFFFSSVMIFRISKEAKEITKYISKSQSISKSKKEQHFYQKKINTILFQYLNMKKDQIISANINEIEKKLLGLKVPVEARDLHLNLVLNFKQLEEYLEINKEKDKIKNIEKNIEKLNEITKEYSWIK